ncbi:MAG: hypothetical protein SGJ26_20435, partial [Nitrospirota bacterium]|nr:hypothetical protein [Nitrospirota bacterium]
RARENVSTLRRPWKSIRNCVINHPLHLELETAHQLRVVSHGKPTSPEPCGASDELSLAQPGST